MRSSQGAQFRFVESFEHEQMRGAVPVGNARTTMARRESDVDLGQAGMQRSTNVVAGALGAVGAARRPNAIGGKPFQSQEDAP
jgi:hypothetical protein